MAQRGLNKAQIIGNLGQDPEVRHTQNGTAVATLSIATSETWKDKQSGEQREKTEWHRVVLWDKLAEIAGEYLKKGSKVYVEGKLETRKWQDQSGADKYTTEIVVKGFDGQLQMLDSRGDGNGQGSNQGGYQSQPQQNQQPVSGTNVQQPNPQAQQGQGCDFDFDDDIPF